MLGSACCRLLLLLLLCLVMLLPTAAAATTRSPAASGDGDDCIPIIANKCFVEVAKDLACQRNAMTRDSTACQDRDALDMCYSLDDALNCTADIIDGDCSASDGRLMYDSWLRGLRGVQSHLCANNATNMRVLIRPTTCWDPAQYLTCLETAARVTHVTDLLTVKLDTEECDRIQRAGSSCAARGADSAQCGQTAAAPAALNTALTAFLLETPCRAVCWQTADRADGGLAQFSGATLAIVLLAVLTLVLAATMLFVSYRTSCFRIPMR